MTAETTMSGRVAIITGAGMGMGAATARLFAARGAHVVVSDVNATAAEETAHAIAEAGGSAAVIVADVADEAAVVALVEGTVARFGRLDCAVNNAAVGPEGKLIHECDLAAFDRVIAVNLRSVFICLKYQLGQFIRQGGGGAIVNVGSTNSRRPQRAGAGYTASKHGVVGLTRNAAFDYAEHGIRVNAVLPGPIKTPMLEAARVRLGQSEEQFAGRLSLFKRLGRPEEVAEASLWLCSDAASFVTGHALAVDAGYLAS